MPPPGHIARRDQQQRSRASRRSAAGGATVAVAVARRKPQLRHLETAHPRRTTRALEALVRVTKTQGVRRRRPRAGRLRVSSSSPVDRTSPDPPELVGHVPAVNQADLSRGQTPSGRAISHARRSYISRLRQNGIFSTTCTRTNATSFSLPARILRAASLSSIFYPPTTPQPAVGRVRTVPGRRNGQNPRETTLSRSYTGRVANS